MNRIIRRFLILAMVSGIFPALIPAQTTRNLLSNTTDADRLGQVLIDRENWHPYPVAGSPDWAKIPDSTRHSYIQKAEQYLGLSWDVLPASVFLDFQRNGNRTRYEQIYFGRRQRLTILLLAEVFENRGRFSDEIANGVWAICEESFWGVPAHIGAQAKGNGLPDVNEPIIDLFAAETGALLAWTSYLAGTVLDGISPRILERIALEEERRIIGPYLARTDFWWMGFEGDRIVNNWNPWINANVLNVALLLERDAKRRAAVVYKTMQSTDAFLNGYPDDGGCDEGPGYWGRAGGSLFDFLDLLFMATDGKIDLFSHPLIKNMGQFIYKSWIHDDYFVNFADASAINQPEAGMVFRFGKRIQDPVMIGFGAFLGNRQVHGRSHGDPDDGSLVRVLPDLLSQAEYLQAARVEPYAAGFWLPGLEVMNARSDPRSAKGLYLAAKGGHNAESHNHNDVGNFVVYADGKPLLIDIGVENYSAKTFSKDRYSIWTMQSSYHNLPAINGFQQQDGPDFKARQVAYSSDARQVTFSMELEKAYPSEAQVVHWHRSIRLIRTQRIELEEQYQLRQWKEPVKLYLMTAADAGITESGRVLLTDRNDPGIRYEIRYDPVKFAVTAEVCPVTDSRLMPVWGNYLTRLVFQARDKDEKGRYRLVIQPSKQP